MKVLSCIGLGHTLVIFFGHTWTKTYCLIMLRGCFIPSKSQQSKSCLWCRSKGGTKYWCYHLKDSVTTHYIFTFQWHTNLMLQSHQTFRPVLAGKLLRNRCWPTTFHLITFIDANGWCQMRLVWSTPRSSRIKIGSTFNLRNCIFILWLIIHR
jgi:hypothetical protein